ncbi:T9SS type A sorting domain-containing protein [Polaribacter ponticola]|uniref:T9SS type A sorting domain-containing protein n=1 Tax=Polaribacter ponticola TaxID=2978475 RepID=A0ABT5SBA7_9FLAO|nr:T9SS type A sorting domain-containing protein [Polaribacter sp. MSW5]MDD7915400.1 T9SS type A sorting domain-containing protein [Polaribacter sp. MSW5]
MKKIYFTFFTLLITAHFLAQTTSIPDVNFERYLIQANIDSDGVINGEVLTADIVNITRVSFSTSDAVHDITGLQDFAALTEFIANSNNQLENLSFSQNSNLERLILTSTQTQTINISNNTKLIELAIYDSYESLVSLDISKNTNLTSLTVVDSQLTSIDISNNTKLAELYLATNQLTSLDVSKNTNLIELNCKENNISSLDVTSLIDLEELYINKNNVSLLDLSNNTKLRSFNAKENKLTLLDFTKNKDLTHVYCDKNEITDLNIQNENNTKIRIFSSENNSDLTCILVDDKEYSDNDSSWYKDTTSRFAEECNEQTAIPDANFESYLEYKGLGNGEDNDGFVDTDKISVVESLDINDESIVDLTGIEDFIALKSLDAGLNSIVNVDFSKNINLEVLNIAQNAITAIDLSKNIKLTELVISRNQLTTIDLSKNVALKDLSIGVNKLDALDVSKLLDLERLWCFSNQLTTLDISKNEKIFLLNCSDNQLENLNVYSNIQLKRIVASYNKLKYIDFQKNTNLVELDVSNNELIGLNVKNGINTVLFSFDVDNNANLTCIEVDDVSFSNTYWTSKDAHSSYSTDCAPVNNNCTNAIPLTFGQVTPGDVKSGNANNNAPCVAGNVIADVWFSIIVPQSGELSVEGAGFGGLLKFAVYETCNSTDPIACGEKISLKNLTVGKNLNLKVWIEAASNKSQNNQSETGTFTLEVNETSVLSLNNSLNDDTKINLYPNPATQFIKISSPVFTVDKVEVFNVIGKRVIFKNAILKKEITLNSSTLSKGIYLIKITSNNKVSSKKLIIN